MLPDKDSRLDAFLGSLEAKRKLSDNEIVASMRDGSSWPKCHRKHLEAKAAISERLGKPVTFQKLPAFHRYNRRSYVL